MYNIYTKYIAIIINIRWDMAIYLFMVILQLLHQIYSEWHEMDFFSLTCTVPAPCAVLLGTYVGHLFTILLCFVYYLIQRAAVLTGRHQIRSGIYPEGIDPSDLGGIIPLIFVC